VAVADWLVMTNPETMRAGAKRERVRARQQRRPR
jgi:hypothetical protein